MTGPLYKLGALAARHWKFVIPIWLVLVVLIVIGANAAGYLGAQLSIPDSASSDRLGIFIAIIILLIVFGTVAAMAMPITTALLALLVGLSLIGFAGQLFEVPQVAPTLGTMLGLAVGIDYSLFIISRYQRQHREGMEPRESVARAIATAGGSAVFAGATVIVAMLCLYFSGIELVRALGYTAATGQAQPPSQAEQQQQVQLQQQQAARPASDPRLQKLVP